MICDAFQMVVVLCQVSNPCSTNSRELVEKVRFAQPIEQVVVGNLYFA